MRIIQANLCLRFYPTCGWTREAVRRLLRDDKRLARVCPRYFRSDHPVEVQYCGTFEVDDDLPYDDCDYFAVYGILEPFDPEALAAHEIV
jgi:hypothetical protein